MLRIVKFLNRSTTEIQIAFNEAIDPNIGISNFKISSNVPNIEDLRILSVEIDSEIVSLTTNLQSPGALYYLKAFSTDLQIFRSVSGELLQENDSDNFIFFLGLEKENEIRDSIIRDAPPVYDLDSNTFVRKYWSALADKILEARTNIRESKNSSYISETVTDEIKTRGFSSTDRLLQESAYEVLRVAKNPSDASISGALVFQKQNAFAALGNQYTKANPGFYKMPGYPISLKSVRTSEIVSNIERVSNKFDGLLVTLSKTNVAAINSVVLNLSNGTSVVYDIPKYKYSLLNNYYDPNYATPLLTLESNQFKLADASVISGDFFEPSGQDELIVNYTYVDNGVDVAEDSLSISEVLRSVREPTGAYLTIFSLKNYPIVNAFGDSISIGGVKFLDPSTSLGLPFTSIHPAFKNEIPYSSTRLPAIPGEYSINYETGQVFVYGQSSPIGTGAQPPVATYYYKKIYKDTIDYNYNSDNDDIVAIPGRDIIGREVNVTFQYDKILSSDIDYKAEVHKEVINEYVENRLISSFCVAPLNAPVTEVFNVYNETTGENYAITRFDDNYIYFTGRQLPRVESSSNELVSFSKVVGEDLYITESLVITPTYKIVEAKLINSNLTSFFGQKGASNLNSTISFSRPDLFVKEFYYDNILQTVDQNLSKLATIGDYLIDYQNGYIYLYADPDQPYDLGEISYEYAAVDVLYENVIGVNDISYKPTTKDTPILSVGYDAFNSREITVSSLPNSLERFYKDNPLSPILLGTVQFGTIGQYNKNTNIFTALDANFTIDLADGYHTLKIVGDSDRSILSIISPTQVVVDVPFTSTRHRVSWTVLDGSPQYPVGDGYKATVTYDILSVKGVYSIFELQTLDSASVTNYFDPLVDVISGNTIYFKNALIGNLTPGTALAIDYSFGRLYADYNYVKDNLLISYEYGDNSLNFAVGNELNPEDEYYVTYRYGALREELIQNFGTLTQMQEMVNVPLEMDRELYRDFLSSAIQGSVLGSTPASLKNSVAIVTKIEPEIKELTFNEWTSDRDHIFLQEPLVTGTPKYEIGKYGTGLHIDESLTLKLPSEAYVSYREGTFETWVRPDWNGIDNDATLTFSFFQDGYQPTNFDDGLIVGNQLSLKDIYIGSSGHHPSSSPFSISRFDLEPKNAVGKPSTFGDRPGIFIWYDDINNNWSMAVSADPESLVSITGRIETSGSFTNVRDGYDDGYAGLESSDSFLSTNDLIEFYVNLDGYELSIVSIGSLIIETGDTLSLDGYGSGGISAGFLAHDIIKFTSDKFHYLMDTGPSLAHNRMSIFKDPSGYLNFRVYDDSGLRMPGRAKMYNLSHNISDWLNGDIHFIAASWRLNSSEGIDEMHLFIDGQEVSNLFKYGGKPSALSTDLYRTVADEILTPALPKSIVGSDDGITISGSSQFSSADSRFEDADIMPGDLLWILDPTTDGAGSPYTIASVIDQNNIVLTSSLILNLSNVKFSINRTAFTTNTNIDVEKFAVFTIDGYGQKVYELRGLDTVNPDYEINRSAGTNQVFINKGVDKGFGLVINTLGLTKGRCRDIVYEYVYDSDGYLFTTNQIETRSAPPANLAHVDIYKVPFPRVSIATDFASDIVDGYFNSIGNDIYGYFYNICQPTNTVNGKRYSISFGGLDNIDLSGSNYITFNGTTYAGGTVETITLDQYGSFSTANFFTSISSILMYFSGYDSSISLGSIEISELVPFTQSENGGEYAQVGSYNNGIFSLFIYGSGGVPFELEPCYYRFDYPTSLNIPMSMKGPLYIGSDITGLNQWHGVIEQPIFLNDMLDDIRVGEDKGTIRTVTQDYNSPIKLGVTPQTLMLLNLDGTIENLEKYYSNFDEKFYTTSNSVNSNFGDAAIFLKEPYVINNGSTVFNNNKGTIEFWVSPIVDTYFDNENIRFYVDITSIEISQLISTTATTVRLNRKAREIISVRLISDDGTGIDYFSNGKLLIDGQTIVLGQALPAQLTLIRVQYVPIDFNGDRVSIYKDGYGSLNFAVISGEDLFKISYPISWQRNTWHRVMASWSTNSIDNKDRIRLFVDGIEGGTITYGTPGLLYGSGVVYGAAAVGSLDESFLTTDINLTDTFGEVYVGSSFDRRFPGSCRIDNLRFSSIVRDPATIAGSSVDLNYNSNLQTVFPVIDDNFTTGIFDFDMELTETQFLATLLSKYTSQYQLDVIIDDSFRRIIDNPTYKDLMIKIVKRLKPAHTNLFVKFLQD